MGNCEMMNRIMIHIYIPNEHTHKQNLDIINTYLTYLHHPHKPIIRLSTDYRVCPEAKNPANVYIH